MTDFGARIPVISLVVGLTKRRRDYGPDDGSQRVSRRYV